MATTSRGRKTAKTRTKRSPRSGFWYGFWTFFGKVVGFAKEARRAYRSGKRSARPTSQRVRVTGRRPTSTRRPGSRGGGGGGGGNPAVDRALIDSGWGPVRPRPAVGTPPAGAEPGTGSGRVPAWQRHGMPAPAEFEARCAEWDDQARAAHGTDDEDRSAGDGGWPPSTTGGRGYPALITALTGCDGPGYQLTQLTPEEVAFLDPADQDYYRYRMEAMGLTPVDPSSAAGGAV